MSVLAPVIGQPKLGATVYSRLGEKAEYVTALPKGGHAVRPKIVLQYQGDEVDESFDGLAEWHEVFTSPPKGKLDEEIAALNAQVEKLRAEVAIARGEHTALDREIKARKDRITAHEKLALLDDYLAGRITHFVSREMHYGGSTDTYRSIQISPFADAIKSEDRWNPKDLKCLILFGDSKGDLAWKLSTYSSGSNSYEVTPCTSLEQAQTVARGFYEHELAQWRECVAQPQPAAAAKQKDNVWGSYGLLHTAKALGIPVPDDVVAAERRRDIERARSVARAAEKALQEAHANMAQVLYGDVRLPLSETAVPPAADTDAEL